MLVGLLIVALVCGSSVSAGAQEVEQQRALVWNLEAIEVRGNAKTASEVIERMIPFAPGSALNVDDARLEQARFRLLGTGFFNDVQLSIERGSQRNYVVLVVRVRERNTVLVQDVAAGVSEGLNRRRDYGDDAYIAATIAESNAFGTGTLVDASFALSFLQQSLRARFRDPHFLGSPLSLELGGFFINGREVYGDQDVLVTNIFDPPTTSTPLFGAEAASYALVRYHRGGISLGTGVATDAATSLGFAYQFEIVDLITRPAAASERLGTEVYPIDFHLRDGTSLISQLRLTLQHDDRDDPLFPRSGRLFRLGTDLAHRVLGSDYDYVRVQAMWREWIGLPNWEHTLAFRTFVGVAVGETPVFYRFYAADLSDLIPSRIHEVTMDRRTPPNLLGTAVEELRTGELGARIDVEYSFQLARPGSGVRAMWAYLDIGAYAIGDSAHFERPIPGYAVSVPIDLTLDLGLRIDTSAGLFQFGLSSLMGFLSL